MNARRKVAAVISSGILLLGAICGFASESSSALELLIEPSQNVLAVRGPVHICANCGGPHGGVHHPNYCKDCIKKGETPVKL